MAGRKKSEPLAKAQYHHGDLRRALLRIARQEIARNGAQTVSLASLAQLAGVSQPAPYRHFADKTALLEAVATEGFLEFDQVLQEACAGVKPRMALQRMAGAYLSFGEANIELYRLMFASRLVPEADGGSPLAKAADGSYDRLRSAVGRLYPADAADKEALLAWAQLHGLVMLRADGFTDRPLSEMKGLELRLPGKPRAKVRRPRQAASGAAVDEP